MEKIAHDAYGRAGCGCRETSRMMRERLRERDEAAFVELVSSDTMADCSGWHRCSSPTGRVPRRSFRRPGWP
jgi:hypothetical protein